MRLFSVKCWLGISLLVSALSAQAANIRDWDTQIHNDTEYTLTDVIHSKDEKGYLIQINTNTVKPHQRILAYNLKANLIGQLSQDLSYVVKDHGERIGECNFHAGLGSFLTYPDFTGSICELDNGDTLSLMPRYLIKNNSYYDVLYTVGHTKSFSRIFAFGDSLTDNGNLYKYDGGFVPKSPPYYHGRFSNGPVWLEHLETHFNLSDERVLNYAYGNAVSGPDPQVIPTLSRQIMNYTMMNPSADPFGMYVVWIGANDFLEGVEDIDTATNNTLDNVVRGIQSLAAHGAKVFLVPNLPDLGSTPKAKEIDRNNGNHDFSQQLSLLTQTYNMKLGMSLQLLANALQVSIIPFDANAQLQDVIKNPDAYGITNTDEVCSQNDYSEAGKPICENPEEYIFWDKVHPTTRVHDEFAKQLVEVFATYGYEPAQNLLALNG